MILFFGGFIYGGFYAINTTLTTQFHAIYHLDDTILGLLFLPQAVGTVIAAFTNGRIIDAIYRHHAQRGGFPLDKKKQPDFSTGDFPIERVRVDFGFPLLCISILCIILYGWLLHFEVPIAGPLVLLAIIGYSTVSAFNVTNVLLIDIHRRRPATATAAGNLVRCLIGAGSSAVINPMIDGMGRGWCFTFIGLFEICLLPCMWVLVKYGPKWRKEKGNAERKREAERKLKPKVADKQQPGKQHEVAGDAAASGTSSSESSRARGDLQSLSAGRIDVGWL